MRHLAQDFGQNTRQYNSRQPDITQILKKHEGHVDKSRLTAYCRIQRQAIGDEAIEIVTNERVNFATEYTHQNPG
jgi:hypothetical protein